MKGLALNYNMPNAQYVAINKTSNQFNICSTHVSTIT